MAKTFDHTNRSLLSFLLPLKVVEWLKELGPIQLTRERIAMLDQASRRD